MSKSTRLPNNYRSCTEAFKTYENPYQLTQTEYNLIVRSFFVLLGQSMVNTGRNYLLPFGLSSLGIAKVPTFGRGVFDYQRYKETGEKIYKKNTHSSGMIGIFKWDNRWPRFKVPPPAYTFKFSACRDLARYLAKRIRENNTIIKYYDY